MTTNSKVFDTKVCTGCKTCVIACSYHHRRVFSLNTSSLEIIDSRQEGKFSIAYYKKNEEPHLACDACRTEKEPLCVKYCNFLARDELRTLLFGQ